jgi:hypothetical protein
MFKNITEFELFSLKFENNQKECKTGSFGKVTVFIVSIAIEKIFSLEIMRLIISSKERELCEPIQIFFPILFIIRQRKLNEFNLNRLKPIINKILSKYLIFKKPEKFKPA